MCIVEGHKDSEKEYIIHICKTVRNKNRKILVLISVTYELIILNQDAKQAYIQADNLHRNVQVIQILKSDYQHILFSKT